ncbi:MAG TPA: lysine--tRNA ligase, partial [Acidimicrobiia bacterium]|nr:lysine--tRNA ligase [Acidimicrobiia bacterium]
MADDEAAIGAEADESALDRIMADRQGRVDALRDAGGDPYPVRFDRTAGAADLHAEHGGLDPQTNTGSSVVVAGRIMSKRDLGAVAFAVLQDGSGRIQLFAEEKVLGERMAEFADLDVGDWVGASGEVVTTRTGELSVRVDDFTLLSKALRPLPEKWHGLTDTEQRYRRRYVDLMVNPDSMRVARARVATVGSIRRSLESRGFIEVETPLLHDLPTGGLATPFTTHHAALDQTMYLRIALELHLKRLVVGGMERVFEIGRVFRNEGLSPRHNPEFTMLEAYQALADYGDMIDLTEAIVVEAAGAVAGTTELTYQDRPLSLTTPWKRLDYVGATTEISGVEWDPVMPVEEARKAADAAGVEYDGSWGTGRIIAEAFEHFVEPTLWEPTVVLDFPEEISPLARLHRSRPGLTERFEVIVAGHELANAFSELNDPVDQRRRFEAQASARDAGDTEAHPMDEDYLRALEYGLPPTGGMGLGIDRLVMLLTD